MVGESELVSSGGVFNTPPKLSFSRGVCSEKGFQGHRQIKQEPSVDSFTIGGKISQPHVMSLESRSASVIVLECRQLAVMLWECQQQHKTITKTITKTCRFSRSCWVSI